MKVLEKGLMLDGTKVQIEEWNEDYNFIPYGSTIASYPKSKSNHKGSFAPKLGEIYRFQFDFKSYDEAKEVLENLINGNTSLSDYKNNLYGGDKYSDCI